MKTKLITKRNVVRNDVAEVHGMRHKHGPYTITLKEFKELTK